MAYLDEERARCPFCSEELDEELDDILFADGLRAGEHIFCPNCEEELRVLRVEPYYEVEPAD